LLTKSCKYGGGTPTMKCVERCGEMSQIRHVAVKEIERSGPTVFKRGQRLQGKFGSNAVGYIALSRALNRERNEVRCAGEDFGQSSGFSVNSRREGAEVPVNVSKGGQGKKGTRRTRGARCWTTEAVPERGVVVFRVVWFPQCFEMGTAFEDANDADVLPRVPYQEFRENEVANPLPVSCLWVC
jgi:hypothetical protein